MARKMKQLTAMAVSKMKEPGLYADGGGLYLRVGPTGAKSWIFRYMRNRHRRDMGLGPEHAISLADARLKAEELRKQLAEDQDPLQMRDDQRLARKLEAAKTVTFKECAEDYIRAHAPGWRNAKHGDQWRNTLATYAYPTIGDLPVQSIDTGLVLKVISPIWESKTETATRVRGRMESILGWATVRSYRSGDNPARWKGHLDHLLPRRAKVQKVEHHPALPVEQMGSFMAALRKQDGIAAKGLELLILTAARTGEVMAARWSEFDLEKKLWTIPPERMKAGKEHRVPLSKAALSIVKAMQEADLSDEFVFPGTRPKKPLSNMAFLQLLKRMKRADLTSHGFRSTFRDWAAERTNYPREVAEMALAHVVSDKVEAAYRRGDLLEKRYRLMEDWAKFCAVEIQEGNILPIGQGKAIGGI
ncbi:phage integrase [Paramagnetospirillum caucaseum]|uniref:Phage integrase n=1 Tax=Paramagnetospirillum caucaseum TaxID=1244869 RepID=M3A7G2_9PROT|nr:integrase arm-type DNA-binding domain-containing protein [Paramagnetospirillum caucaseum]EME68718.1 phage integrase [Paramagnetospirillum caucaseum]